MSEIKNQHNGSTTVLWVCDLPIPERQPSKTSPATSFIGRLHRTRTTGIRSTGLVRQDRQILTNKDK